MSICKDYGCRVVDMYMHLLPCHWAHQQPSACKVIRMNLGPGVHPSVVDMESKGSCCRGLCNDDTAMHCSIRTKVRTIPACQNGSTHNLYMHCPSYMCHLRKESMPPILKPISCLDEFPVRPKLDKSRGWVATAGVGFQLTFEILFVDDIRGVSHKSCRGDAVAHIVETRRNLGLNSHDMYTYGNATLMTMMLVCPYTYILLCFLSCTIIIYNYYVL